MKNYDSAKAAHEANNEVMLAARRMAEERGVAMSIVVASQVEGRDHQTMGVEYTRAENIDLVCSLASAAVGVLSKQSANQRTEAEADHLAKMFVLGNHHAAEALDRNRVGGEAPPVTPESVKLGPDVGAKLDCVVALLEKNGCDCDCDCGGFPEEVHATDCERCLACRISEAIS